MEDKKVYVTSLLEQIQQVAELLYQQKKAEAMARFKKLLDLLSQASQLFYQWSESGEVHQFDRKKYLDVLVQTMNALEAGDDVLVADIMNYDLRDQLEAMLEEL